MESTNCANSVYGATSNDHENEGEGKNKCILIAYLQEIIRILKITPGKNALHSPIYLSSGLEGPVLF